MKSLEEIRTEYRKIELEHAELVDRWKGDEGLTDKEMQRMGDLENELEVLQGEIRRREK